MFFSSYDSSQGRRQEEGLFFEGFCWRIGRQIHLWLFFLERKILLLKANTWRIRFLPRVVRG
jgi:hypothetical protein